MTQFNYFRCDECSKILERTECSPMQLMYTLVACYDTDYDGYKAHFCSDTCLINYVKSKVKNHHNLPTIKDGDRLRESETLGEINNQKELN